MSTSLFSLGNTDARPHHTLLQTSHKVLKNTSVLFQFVALVYDEFMEHPMFDAPSLILLYNAGIWGMSVHLVILSLPPPFFYFHAERAFHRV